MKWTDFARGNRRFRDGDYEGAISSYRDAINKHPELHHYYRNLADVLRLVARESEAASLYATADKFQHRHLGAANAVEESTVGRPAFDPPDQRPLRLEGWEDDPAVKPMLTTVPNEEEQLKKSYLASPLSSAPDTFVLCRIIGNDLLPRHRKGQSRDNLRFVLENEPSLNDCQRLWVVNRIFDPDEKVAILELLRNHNQEYIDIPFVSEDYRARDWDFSCLPFPGYLASEEFQGLGPEQRDRVKVALYRLKNLYLMNNNGARNVALREGRCRAKWVLPWDGNCFLTETAWEEIKSAIVDRPHLKYYVVPMQRMSDNTLLLTEDLTPYPVEEPQLIFRCDTDEEFNEAFPYGRRPKVELFWHLNVPGNWSRWKDDAWDQPRRDTSDDAPAFGVAGWVARMFSGVKALEQQGDRRSFKDRGQVRQEAIIDAINYVDRCVHPQGASGRLAFYSEATLAEVAAEYDADPHSPQPRIVDELIRNAEAALQSGPYSVVEKTTLPPSGNSHDYWHPAPYWWPDPAKPDGLPYVKKDGQRVPGTRMYEPESAKYDRTRLQRMFDETLTLALAWKVTGRTEFAEHGAKLLRTWFISSQTRMNPHLEYAQVRRGRNNDKGYSRGIIELKDLYFFLDAVRILEQSGRLSEDDIRVFRKWLHDYKQWLDSSPQGRAELCSENNHGTYYDLQTAAICSYLGEYGELQDTILRAQSRIVQQIDEDGAQPNELTRTITQHYVFFNLQGFLNTFRVAHAAGLPPIDVDRDPGLRLRSALNWILRRTSKEWPYKQIEKFDDDRILPLISAAMELGVIDRISDARPYSELDLNEVKPVFDPHDAVNPYFQLSRGNWGIRSKSAIQKRVASAKGLFQNEDYGEAKKILLEICSVAGREAPKVVFQELRNLESRSKESRGCLSEGLKVAFNNDCTGRRFRCASAALRSGAAADACEKFAEGLTEEVANAKLRRRWMGAFSLLAGMVCGCETETGQWRVAAQKRSAPRMKVFVSGMHTSGSSAVADYLSEFEGVDKVPYEHKHLEGKDGLIKLKSVLHDGDAFRETLRRFFSVTVFGYAEDLASANQAKAVSLATGLRTGRGADKYVDGVLRCLEEFRQLSFDGSERDQEIFSHGAEALIDGICMRFRPHAKVWVLDNVLHTRSIGALTWIDHAVNVCVVRDPRCNFVSRVRKRTVSPWDVDKYIVEYRRHRENLKREVKKVNLLAQYEKCMVVRFEDFVLGPGVRDRVREVVGLDQATHVEAGVRFVQEESQERLRRHEEYGTQEDIEKLARDLNEYVVDFNGLPCGEKIQGTEC